MAYNPYYPNNYQMAQPYPPYQQPAYPQQPIPPAPQSQPMQIQNGGFISVQSEYEARQWNVAPGTSITFKDENAPYCYEKTKGFSQLDKPTFKKYRLVEEVDESQTPQNAQNAPVSGATPQQSNDVAYALRSDLDALRAAVTAEFAAIRSEVSNITAPQQTAPVTAAKKTTAKTKKESDEQ